MSMKQEAGETAAPERTETPPPKRPFEAAHRINTVLERFMPIITPLGVLLGILLPQVFIHLRPFVPLLFAGITLSGSLKLKARELGKAVSSPLPILLFFFSAHILMPLIVLCVSRLVFGQDPETVVGYVLLYSVPTAVTGFIWITIFKGDPALSLTVILLDSILAPLVVPGTVRLLLGTSVTMDMTGMMISLIFMVVIPTIVGVTLNETSRGKIPAVITPLLSPLAKIFIALMVAANASAVSHLVRLDNPRVWLIMAVCIGFSSLSFMSGRLMGIAGRLDREKQITLFFASGLRNISAAMTLAIQFFPAAAALPVVLGILFQQSTAAIMGRIALGKSRDKQQ